jgi:predicted AAA+ superfamily ATPase
MDRVYSQLIEEHLKQYQQMLFLAGPRQVGKTTLSMATQSLTDSFNYLNWDNLDHRKLILEGPGQIAQFVGLQKLLAHKPILVLDEIHKYSSWKTFLKGFYDTYRDQLVIIITGSSKLDIYKRGEGDSLMGRYFPYRIYPITVAECLRISISPKEIAMPQSIDNEKFQALLQFGGFPEPFLNHSEAFSKRWQSLRREQLIRGDIRDLSRIHEISQLEVLAELLKYQVGQLVNYSSFANKVKVSVDTIRRWMEVLNQFYYCFLIRPWTKNISRSLIKEPKVYLWDWSVVPDKGQRFENFIACHLLKAIHFWNDRGLGEYGLYFIRDKEKREVDFLITKDNIPWFLVEAKAGESAGLSKHLEYFQSQLKASHAFQVVSDMDYIDANCFAHKTPLIVPARTLLSQFV